MSAIKYLKANRVGKLVRPNGYGFPVGLGSNPNLFVDYLVVAGGGGGGSAFGGGGGAGGSGSTTTPVAGTSGSPNTGGGGGGAGNSGSTGTGGGGGKGIVIIRYSGDQKATGGSYANTSGGFTYHTFLGDGTFTANTIATVYSIN